MAGGWMLDQNRVSGRSMPVCRFLGGFRSIDRSKEFNEVIPCPFQLLLNCRTDHQIREQTLPFEKGVDPLLEGSFGDDPVDVDALLLSDPVHPVRGLILYRGIPPAVNMDHMVRPCEVNSVAAGLDAQEGNLVLSLVEVVKVLLPICGLSIDPHEGDPPLLQNVANEVEHL